jgi:hypothetical protein
MQSTINLEGKGKEGHILNINYSLVVKAKMGFSPQNDQPLPVEKIDNLLDTIVKFASIRLKQKENRL